MPPAEAFVGAACVGIDGDLFFPEWSRNVGPAKRVCNGDGKDVPPCPVRAACLEWALENDERFGVWGGTSEQDRRKLKRARGDEPDGGDAA